MSYVKQTYTNISMHGVYLQLPTTRTSQSGPDQVAQKVWSMIRILYAPQSPTTLKNLNTLKNPQEP